MKQVLLIFLPIVFLGILITGGLQITDPQRVGPVTTFILGLIDNPSSAQNSLQIRTLQEGVSTGSPYGTPPVYGTPPIYGTPPVLPSPTPIVPFCPSKSVGVSLLIDTSNTMDASKMLKVKEALKLFPKYISNNTRIGIQRFSSPRVLGSSGFPGTATVLEIGPYSEGAYNAAVDNLPPSGSGSTYIKNGFELARSKINGARGGASEWFLILLSDGLPQSDNLQVGKPLGLEFAPYDDQNPNLGSNIATQIKSSGVKIIAIGLDVDGLDGQFFRNDKLMSNYARGLLGAAQNAGYSEAASENELAEKFRLVARDPVCK